MAEGLCGLGAVGLQLQVTTTIAEFFHVYLHAIEEREPQVADWSFFCVSDVSAGVESAATAACDEDWEVFVVVCVPVMDAATVGDHSVIEEGAVTFLDRV